ncbi:MAG: hypothetical protein GWQ05_27755 [Verrucomicrobiaceae bacterium]|nr:hypothetical protein [Verrucomicrobiaceae bacterium]
MRTSLAALCFLVLIACQSKDRPAHDPSGFENPVGMAALLYLIAEAKTTYPDNAVPYALGVGGALRPASEAFMESLADEGHAFLKMDQLDYDRVTKATVIKGGRENPIVFQLSKISQKEPGSHELEVAWNRNKDVVRKILRVTGDPDKGPLSVSEISVLEDTRLPEDQR